MPESAEHLLAALSAEPRDKERILTWATCGFSCAAAARARPDLGAERTFQRTVDAYQEALAGALRAILAESVTTS